MCVAPGKFPILADQVDPKHPNIPLTALRAGVLRTRWDFSRVRPALIPSLAGKHEGWPAVLKSGHTALMRAVTRLNPQRRAVSLEYQVRPPLQSEDSEHPKIMIDYPRDHPSEHTAPGGSPSLSVLRGEPAPRQRSTRQNHAGRRRRCPRRAR